MIVVLEGTLSEGFKAYGPFNSELAAVSFMEDREKKAGSEPLHLMYIHSPKDCVL